MQTTSKAGAGNERKAVVVVPSQEAARPPAHEEIARRAYEIFLEHGGHGDQAAEDWLRAEAELRGRPVADA